MPEPKFIQIHNLHGYSSVLLNRDDTGLAKRMTYGGKTRTRISSQCLKRHWRMANDVNALQTIDGATLAYRSREIVSRKVIEPLNLITDNEDLIRVIESEFQRAVYGDKGDTKANRQPLLLGEPEILYLAQEAKKFVDTYNGELNSTKESLKEWSKSSKANMNEMRNNCKLPGGLVSALFGRMVTSDTEANIYAAIHVAHAFTVHEEESESDYFAVVDDLQRIEDDAGASHIGETELTSGLFYGYVVVDRDMLIGNLGGDTNIGGEVVKRLVHLIATVSPGAKLGSTAPYNYASWMLIEAGDRQPRSLAEAFRRPCQPLVDPSHKAICEHIQILDELYGKNEVRRAMNLMNSPVPGAELVSLNDLAKWVGSLVEFGVA